MMWISWKITYRPARLQTSSEGTSEPVQKLTKDGTLTCEKKKNKNLYNLYTVVREYCDYVAKLGKKRFRQLKRKRRWRRSGQTGKSGAGRAGNAGAERKASCGRGCGADDIRSRDGHPLFFYGAARQGGGGTGWNQRRNRVIRTPENRSQCDIGGSVKL